MIFFEHYFYESIVNKSLYFINFTTNTPPEKNCDIFFACICGILCCRSFFFESICHTFLVTVTMRKAVQLEIVAANISSIKMYHIEESFFAFFYVQNNCDFTHLIQQNFFPLTLQNCSEKERNKKEEANKPS